MELMDLDKVYNKSDSIALQQVFHIYGVGGHLLKTEKSFNKESGAMREYRYRERGIVSSKVWTTTWLCDVDIDI